MPPSLMPRVPAYAGLPGGGYGAHPPPSRVPAVTYRTYPTDYPQSRSGYVPLPGYGRPAYGLAPLVIPLIAAGTTLVGGLASLLGGRQAGKQAEKQQAADSQLAQMQAMQQAAAQQQQMMMQQQASSQQTMLLAGGGLIALLAAGGIAFAITRRKNGRRRNSSTTALAMVPAIASAAAAIAGPIAMAVSYSRNGSLLWAFGAGFVGVPYLVYAALTPKKRAEAARKNRTRRYRRSH